MSHLYEPAYATPHYALIRPAGGYGIVLAAGPGTPTALSLPAAGYAPGCLYIDITNHVLYRNDGSVTASSFTKVAGVGDTLATLTVTDLTATNAAISNASIGTPSITGNTTIADAKNVVLNATTGTQIGTAANQKLGVWGATPIIQPSGAGEGSGSAGLQGSGTATTTYVANTSNFTGNTGNKAYTINDIVKALKNAGIVAASG